MKKIVAILLVYPTLCCLLNAGLLDFYKKGTIKLDASPGFGVHTDWESLFSDTGKEIAIAPNGIIFVSNSKQHTISKLAPQNNLYK